MIKGGSFFIFFYFLYFTYNLVFAITVYCDLTRLDSYTDMEGIIPLEEEQDTYDDCVPMSAANMPPPIDEDIYEELPGLAF